MKTKSTMSTDVTPRSLPFSSARALALMVLVVAACGRPKGAAPAPPAGDGGDPPSVSDPGGDVHDTSAPEPEPEPGAPPDDADVSDPGGDRP